MSNLFSGALYGVTDGGPWRGPTMEEWLVRISAPSTPAGETIPWIKRSPNARNDVSRVHESQPLDPD